MVKWRYTSHHSQTQHWLKLGNQLHDPGALNPWKELPYPLGKRLGEPQSQFGCFGEA